MYRPYNPAIRNNLDNWLFNNRIWLNLVWDKRDFVMNPTSGFLLNQLTTYNGGFLGGNTHYIKSQSKAEAFVKLLDIPVKDNDWVVVGATPGKMLKQGFTSHKI